MMGKRFILPMLLTAASCLFVSCRDYQADSMVRQLPEGMRADFMDYYHGGGYKAFVVAVDSEDVWALGSAYNATTMVSAKGWAMKRCKISKRNNQNVESPCRLFAVGNELWLGKDAETSDQ